MIAQVEECQTFILCITAYFVANLVRYVVLEPAFVDVKHFVEHARDMESDAVEFFRTMLFLHILHCQPFAIRERIFQFVAVEICFFGTEDRCNFRQLDVTEASEVVNYLFLFVADLFVVREDLPFATTASAVVFAYGFAAFFAVRVELDDATFHVVFLLFEYLEVNNIARYGILCENNHIVDFSNSFAFGSDVGDCNFVENRELFLFACHI